MARFYTDEPRWWIGVFCLILVVAMFLTAISNLVWPVVEGATQ